MLVILGAVAVFAGVSYGINANRQTGLKAPDTITVDGKPYSLQQGHILIFFYDPECMHCDAAARRMAKLNWKDTEDCRHPYPRAAVRRRLPPRHRAEGRHFERSRTHAGNLQFVDPPYGVALDDGRQKVAIASWDDAEPAKTLREIGYIE